MCEQDVVKCSEALSYIMYVVFCEQSGANSPHTDGNRKVRQESKD